MTNAGVRNGWESLPNGFDVEFRNSIPVRISDNGHGMTVPEEVLLEEVAALARELEAAQHNNETLITRQQELEEQAEQLDAQVKQQQQCVHSAGGTLQRQLTGALTVCEWQR